MNLRHAEEVTLADSIDLAVCDVSFISVTQILPTLAAILAANGEMVVLIKPQFEVSRGQVGKGGIVRDPALHDAACGRVREAVERLGFQTEIIPSPILGAEGNREFLLYGTH